MALPHLEPFEDQLIELIRTHDTHGLAKAIATPPKSVSANHPDRTIVRVNSYKGQRLLSVAVREKSPASIETLMELGAWADLENHDGTPPLCLCVRLRQQEEAAALLASGANPDAACREIIHTGLRRHCCPLYIALQHGYFEMAELLLAYGANPNGVEGLGGPLFAAPYRYGNPPFHRWAATFELLAVHGADLQLKNHHGQSLLHHYLHDEQIMRFLLYRGLDPDVRDAQGKTPLMRLVEADDPLYKCVEDLLVDFGAREDFGLPEEDLP